MVAPEILRALVTRRGALAITDVTLDHEARRVMLVARRDAAMAAIYSRILTPEGKRYFGTR